MSISLGVRWPDGRYEIVAVAGQSTARWWAELGRELGLPLILEIEFNGWPQFGPAELEPLIAEFGRLRERIAALYPDPAEPGWSHPTQPIDWAVAALEKLRGHDGWEGDFG